MPAAIVLSNGCGAYRLERDGTIVKLPRHWLARHGSGTGRTYGADLELGASHGGRTVVTRHGRPVWRSAVHRGGTGNVAFGPHALAFSTYRGGVYLTDLRGPERLVLRGTGLYAYDFDARGRLLVAGPKWLAVLAPDGRTLRRYRFRRANGYAFDSRTGTLYFVTRAGELAAADGSRLRRIRPLRVDGAMTFSRPGLLVFQGGYGVSVTRTDGALVARASWRRSGLSRLDSGISVAPDGRAFAFRLTDGGRSAPRRAAIEVLRPGESRLHTIDVHRLLPSGCAVGANLRWHGSSLLYDSSDGRVAVFDTSRRRAVELGSIGLPRLTRLDRTNAGWASEFRA